MENIFVNFSFEEINSRIILAFKLDGITATKPSLA